MNVFDNVEMDGVVGVFRVGTTPVNVGEETIRQNSSNGSTRTSNFISNLAKESGGSDHLLQNVEFGREGIASVSNLIQQLIYRKDVILQRFLRQGHLFSKI